MQGVQTEGAENEMEWICHRGEWCMEWGYPLGPSSKYRGLWLRSPGRVASPPPSEGPAENEFGALYLSQNPSGEKKI